MNENQMRLSSEAYDALQDAGKTTDNIVKMLRNYGVRGLSDVKEQPEPTNYNLGQQAQVYTKNPTVVPYKPTLDPALRQAIINQPDYDLNTQSVSRLLHEEILAKQTKNYELKLDATRREIAELKLSQPRKGCWPPDGTLDGTYHWLTYNVNGHIYIDRARWVDRGDDSFWERFIGTWNPTADFAELCQCAYGGEATNPCDVESESRLVHVEYKKSTPTQVQNPVTAAPTTTKATPFPLNALTNQTQRIGLTTERRL